MSELQPAAIRTQGLQRRFGSLIALAGIDYEVPKGVVSGLIGPNGAGKTTLLSLLCGFLKPSAGRGEVLGEPMGQISTLKGRLGILPQDASLDPRRSVLAQLSVWAELIGFPRAEAQQLARRGLATVGLGDRANERAANLSHGMAKRVGIAGAFLGAPELVLLDEPTAGLDPRAAHEVRGLISQLGQKATVVISSHNLAELQSICDHATILQEGKILVSGALDAITVADTEMQITLTAPPLDKVLASIRALPKVTHAHASPDLPILTVRFTSQDERPPEAALGPVLQILLDANQWIREIRRGRSLEDRFLELTRSGAQSAPHASGSAKSAS